jgi:hypothetical protein
LIEEEVVERGHLDERLAHQDSHLPFVFRIQQVARALLLRPERLEHLQGLGSEGELRRQGDDAGGSSEGTEE